MTRSDTNVPNNLRQQRTVLLATDQKNSALADIGGDGINRMAYSAYGFQSTEHEVDTRLGFNGQFREALNWYFLGNGYRVYNSRLMRFHSPDSWSPFGEGGLNAYMYCAGDPVNFSDPTGHMPINFLKKINLPRHRVSRNNSTSSLSPLIPGSGSPPPTRAVARPVGSANGPASTSLDTVSERPPMRSSDSMTPRRDPTTREYIHSTLPSGRRYWTPPSSSPLPREMMTYEEMAQRQGHTGGGSMPGLASQSPPGPPVDRSTKPKIRKSAQRPLPLTPDDHAMGLSMDSTGEVRVDLNTYSQHMRRKT